MHGILEKILATKYDEINYYKAEIEKAKTEILNYADVEKMQQELNRLNELLKRVRQSLFSGEKIITEDLDLSQILDFIPKKSIFLPKSP